MKRNSLVLLTILIVMPANTVAANNILNTDTSDYFFAVKSNILDEYGYCHSNYINFFYEDVYKNEKDFSTANYFGLSYSRYIKNIRSRIGFTNYYEEFHTEEGGQNSFIFINADFEFFYDYLSYRMGLFGLLAREGSSGPKGFAFPSAGLKAGYLKKIFISIDFVDIYTPGYLTIALNYKFERPYTFFIVGINYSDERNVFIQQNLLLFQFMVLDIKYIFQRKSLRYGVGFTF